MSSASDALVAPAGGCHAVTRTEWRPARRLLLRWLSVCRQEGRETLQRVVAPDRPGAAEVAERVLAAGGTEHAACGAAALTVAPMWTRAAV